MKWLSPDNLLLFSTFLMEGLWLYLWLALLGNGGFLGWKEVPLTLGSILLLLWSSYYGVQLLGQQLTWTSRKAHRMTGVVIVGLMLVVARLENGGGYSLLDPAWFRFASHNLAEAIFTPLQVTIAASIYLWWRGYRLAQEGLTQEQVHHSFIVGLVGVILGLIAWEGAIKSGGLVGISRGQPVLVVVLFFFASLMGLALSHLMHVRAEMMRRDGAGAFFSQPWTLQLLGLVTAMVVIGWVAASVFSFNALSPVFALVGLLSNLLSILLYYLLYPVALLAAGAVYAVQWLVRRFGGDRQPPNITIPDFSALRKLAEEGDAGGAPLWFVLIKWAVLLALLGGAILLLTRLLLARRRGIKPSEALEESHQSIGGWREFLRDVLLGLVRLLWWFRDKRDAALRRLPLARRAPSWGAPGEELEVREMYAHLLAEARDAGFPRQQQETPLEYLGTLLARLPEESPALEGITHSYVSVRYGERPVPPEEKGLLNRLWRGVWGRIRGVAPPPK
ncbi:MAG: DUF4129 domain-containing protein [Chloroflexi bacterium]|nr:DUF4129 domain-containing protein [Chloroflexota bacterium]